MYIMLCFSRRTRVLFSAVRIDKYLTQVSFLQLLAVGYPLPDLLSRLVLSEMQEIFVFERQISHAKQINLSVKITNSNAG